MGTALALLITCAAVAADDKPMSKKDLEEHVQKMVDESRKPAEAALKQFAKLVNKDNFKSLGFKSVDEVKKAELGKPLPVLLVRLDELKAYKEKGDAYKLLHPIPRVVYAVLVKDQVRSGLEVQKQGDKWESSSFGIAGSARLYAQALKKHIEKDKPKRFFIIRIPALNHVYLGYQTDQGAKLVHVKKQAEQADKIEARPAAEILAELVKEAKEHDGKLR
jgi:hypothetical protein